MVVTSLTLDKATLGIKRPLFVDLISSIDDASGDVVPIPTCANDLPTAKNKRDIM